MLIDLHSHYPMHIRPRRRGGHGGRLAPTLLDRADASVVAAGSRLWNHASFRSGPRVTAESLHAGGVGVALSVLCVPLVEMGERLMKAYRRRPPYGSPPRDGYRDIVLRQLEAVEQAIEAEGGWRFAVARDPRQLDELLTAGRPTLVHCLEGGFALGGTVAGVRHAVHALAERGLAYVTLAHLFWRHFATNVPAVPFMSDRTYRRLFAQPDAGLTELGRAAVEAMVEEGVLVDITHMSARAIDELFDMLDVLDPGRQVPVLATHVGVRLGRRLYNLDVPTVQRIAERDGVIGLLLSEHFMTDGSCRPAPRSRQQSLEALRRHIDAIHVITGTFDHIAIGTDLDGFIKPTLAGFPDSRALAELPDELAHSYGAATATAIANGNALRVLRKGWRPAQAARSP